MRMNLGSYGDKIYRSRVNYTEMEGGYDYTDRLRLTSAKTKELLSMVGPFLHQATNHGHVPSEKQFLNTALHSLGTRQCHSVCDVHGVSKARVHIPILSLTEEDEGVRNV